MTRLTIAILALLLCAGCGTNNPMTITNPTPKCVPSSSPNFAYVLNYSDATISMYTVNSCTGALVATTPATISTGIRTGINAESMVVDHAGKFLYVANLVSNATDAATISMFTIDRTTGVLTPTSPAMVPTGFFPQGITVDPFSKFVFTANSDDNSVSTFLLDSSTGLLTPASPASTPVPPVYLSRGLDSSPDFVTVDPAGRFLYVTEQDNGAISIFSINSTTGQLTQVDPPGVVAGVDPYALIFDPSGKFAYVPDPGLSEVWMFTVDPASGALTPNSTMAVPAGNQSATMAIDPSSKFAYVVNRYDNTVSMFTIDSTTGTLTPNTPATIKAGSWPYPIALNPAGTFAYVGNQSDNSISIYSVGPQGVLVPAGTAATGNDPIAIAITH